MPMYEYCCDACGHRDEILQKFSDAPLVCCPACGKDSFVKQISHASFHLKGTGWYVTDFKDKPQPTSTPKADTAATDKKVDDSPVKTTKPTDNTSTTSD